MPQEQCYRGIFLDEEWEYEQYVRELSEKVSKNASDFVSFNNRGVARFEMGKPEAALEDLMVACRLAPHEHVPLLNVADVLVYKKDLRGALNAATDAVRIAPKESSCYAVRAGIYAKLGDKVRAAQDKKAAKKYESA